MVMRRHCSGRKAMMIYSKNIITQQSTSDVISDPNEWLHSSMGREQIKTTKHNNQQQ